MKLIDGEIRIVYSEIWTDLPRHIRDDGGFIVSFSSITNRVNVAMEREIQRRNKIATIILDTLKRCDNRYKSGNHDSLQCKECGYIG